MGKIFFLLLLLTPPFLVLYVVVVVFSMKYISRQRVRGHVLRLGLLLSALLSWESLFRIRSHLSSLHYETYVYTCFIFISLGIILYVFTSKKLNTYVNYFFTFFLITGMLFFSFSDYFSFASLQLVAVYGCILILLWSIEFYNTQIDSFNSKPDKFAQLGLLLAIYVLTLFFFRSGDLNTLSLRRIQSQYRGVIYDYCKTHFNEFLEINQNIRITSNQIFEEDKYFKSGVSLIFDKNDFFIEYDLKIILHSNHKVGSIGFYFNINKELEALKAKIKRGAKALKFYNQPSLKSLVYDGAGDTVYQYLVGLENMK